MTESLSGNARCTVQTPGSDATLPDRRTPTRERERGRGGGKARAIALSEAFQANTGNFLSKAKHNVIVLGTGKKRMGKLHLLFT